MNSPVWLGSSAFGDAGCSLNVVDRLDSTSTGRFVLNFQGRIADSQPLSDTERPARMIGNNFTIGDFVKDLPSN